MSDLSFSQLSKHTLTSESKYTELLTDTSVIWVCYGDGGNWAQAVES